MLNVSSEHSFKIYYLRSFSKAMASREYEGRTEIQKIECLGNEKSLLGEKNLFK